MNWKLVSAFVTGAILASGIVYLKLKPSVAAAPDAVKAIAPLPTPQIAAAPPRPVAESPAVSKAPARVRVPIREKPSPMPPPARHKQEAVIAKSVPPPEPEPAGVVPSDPPPPAMLPPVVPVESVSVEKLSLPAAPPDVEARVPHTVTLAAGTLLPARIGETISSARNQVGDTFLATLTQPLVIDGFIIAERGARLEGRVVDATPAGRGKGASHLGISIVRLATSDGQNIRIRTEPYVKDGPTSTGTDAAKIGGGAALGAIIGAIAGGGKGAAIGAGAGGAAGTGDVLLTRGKPAEIPVETRVSFKVQDSVTITERLD